MTYEPSFFFYGCMLGSRFPACVGETRLIHQRVFWLQGNGLAGRQAK
jgi:hypothetical protein